MMLPSKPWILTSAPALFLIGVVLGLSGCTSSAQLACDSGGRKWDQGDFDGALTEYSRAITLDPRYARGYRGKGAVLQKKGNLDAAITEYDRAIDLDPSDWRACYNRATAKQAKGDLDGAVLDYTRVLEIGPGSEEAYFGRANAKHAKGDYDGSIADLTRSLELNPRNFKSFANRGHSKQAKRDWDGAIEDYTRALEINSKDDETIDRRGQAKQEKGDFDGAIEDFTKAIEITPDEVEYHCHRGTAKVAKEDWDGAIADFTRALGMDSTNPCLYSNRGVAKLGKKDWDGAIDDFRRAVEFHPKDANSYLGLAQALFFKKDLKGANAALAKVLEIDPKTLGKGHEKGGKEMLRLLDATLADIAAKVNGEVLTWTYVRERLQYLKPDQITPGLLQDKRRELVEAILLRQFASRRHLTVSEEEIDQAVARDRQKYGSAEEHQKVIYIRYGSTANYRGAWQWELLRSKALDHAIATAGSDPELKSATFSPAVVPLEDLRRYFDFHQDQFQGAMEQISFTRIGLQFTGPGQKTQKQAVAESLLRRLEKGSEFTMLAYFYSDVRRAKEFRDRGVTRADLKGLYEPETIRYLFDVLKEGETSPIVTDGSTLNIFKMEQKTKHEAETFEQAQGRIRSLLEAQTRGSNMANLIQALRKAGTVEPADVFQEK